MSGLNDLKKRLNYHGGTRQVDRMVEDKKRSLNKSLLYSYQSATAVLKDGREFRCLINPNKVSMELDDKILSIPFEDICLNRKKPAGAITSSGKEPTNVKCGDVIEWKENGTHWLIYSQYLQEIAYFRGQMRQCEDEALELDGQKFWYYLKGPDEKTIDWQKSKHFILNDLNYTLEIYISNTTVTKQFFQRFKKCTIQGKPFEVQAVDDLSIKGILTVYLKETHSNQWAPEDIVDTTPTNPPLVKPEEEVPDNTPIIEGPAQVYPFDTVEYKILNKAGGKWLLSNRRAKIIKADENTVTIEITTGKSGNVSLIYRTDSIDDIIFNIEILSL